MNIYDFADAIDKSIIITRYPNQNERFSAHFKCGEIKVNSCLASSYGNGWTPNEAINAYTSMINGCTIVFNASDPNYRQMYTVPKLERV